MEKLQYLLRLPAGTTPSEVREQFTGEVARALLALDPAALSMDLDDDDAQIAPPLPLPEGEEPIRAIVSIWLGNYDHRHPFEDVLRASSTTLDGYLVCESLYDDYGTTRFGGPRTWADGERSPGVLTVSVFERPDRFAGDEAGWYEFWHTRQSPMSADVQPRARYVRNSVFRPVTPEAPPWRAIVEEAWPTLEDVTDPMRFYRADGDPDVLQRNLSTMLDHVTHLMDLDRLRVHTMSEYLVRSTPW